jgi:hypothetical protein
LAGSRKKGSSKALASKSRSDALATKPLYPYTNKPKSLRRLLNEIPKRPKPTKVNFDMLRSWGFNDSNDQSVLRVLKAVHLIDQGNVPTENYVKFMSIDQGPAVLGKALRQVYPALFEASHEPYNEPSEKLKNLFNIHSGGDRRVIEYQIQTFKALCEYATFDAQPGADEPITPSGIADQLRVDSSARSGAGPVVNINLHIHLPENKSRRDYEDIIEDIGRYIFGKEVSDRRER